MKILITGAAGFIGFHTVLRLLEQGHQVVGLDNINDYYDVRVKYGRLAHSGIAEANIAENRMVQSTIHPDYRFVRMDLENGNGVMDLFAREKFDRVMHYAAQAGVRYSLTNPHAYMQSNFVAFLNLLEACRHHPVSHFAYASSSSVYGLNQAMPFSVHHNVDHPISLYAASKKSNELMAHTYSYLYNIPTTGLRFFTVYGPWGRPDMALFLFTKAILENRPIDVFNHGKMQRDFTYVDDIVEGVLRVIDHAPAGNQAWNGNSPDPSTSPAPWRVYNIGNSDKVELIQFIEALEEALGKKAQKNFLPLQPGDVPATWADTTDLEHDLGYRPNTPVQVGIQRFVEWYRDFFQV
ncbi:NAD-dependent epimerase [Desulfonatronum thioautotrophicum]|uniref:NAD-dependent epimerase n=1 Tax=Desulfonatronum thioautotrophicum TaxID=617001 RepID=UPI0005EB9D8A|nr:NAD-dependent epimerase [Desulfonatronum thioautotrophicum]